jgi:hypothetical protein
LCLKMRAGSFVTAVMLVLAVGCSSSHPAPSPTPSATPPPSPANPVVDQLIEGHAHLELGGDIEQTYEWDLVAASNQDDLSILSWGRGLNYFDLLARRDSLVVGTRRSTPALWITLVLDSIHQSFVSDQGECRITLSSVDEGSLAGTVTCGALTSKGRRKTIELAVTFAAGPRGS